jgi:uncharacterized protein with HEPN domain
VAKRGKKKGRPAGGIITRVKLGIKEKRQKKKDEDNNKRFRRYNKRKQRRLYALGRIGEKAQKIGKRMGKENPKTRWKMQRGRD